MNDPRPRPPRRVKTRVLLAAAAGATVLSLVNCGPMTSGNLLAPCGTDAGPPGCYQQTTDAGVKVDAGSRDAGTLGGDH